jgi:hypothetical protein
MIPQPGAAPFPQVSSGRLCPRTAIEGSSVVGAPLTGPVRATSPKPSLAPPISDRSTLQSAFGLGNKVRRAWYRRKPADRR